LLLDGRRVLLADFGLAQLLWLPWGVRGAAVLSPPPADGAGSRVGRYTAPELAQRLITRSCDQYSLAVIYQEMLTGHHPFRGRLAAARSWKTRPLTAADVTRGRAGPDGPNLLALAPAEREVVARGLDPDPEKRYGSCAEFVRALRAAGAEGLADTPRPEPAQTPPAAPPAP